MLNHSKRIKKKVKDDYNKIAEAFSETRSFPWEEFLEFLPYYEAHFQVADLGCGNGRLLHFLDEQGVAAYIGVDQSEELLTLAQKAHPGRVFLLDDISELKKLERPFDALFAIASFHHIPPAEQLSALKRWHSLLKPGGYLFMTNWNLHQKRFWKARLRALLWPIYGLNGLLIPWKKNVKRYYYAFTNRRLARLLKQAGFTIVEQETGKNILSIAKK